MKYRTYIAKRIVMLIPVIVGVTFFTFFLSNYVGNPLTAYLDEFMINRMTDEEIEELEHQLGLDRPWFIRYFSYIQDMVGGFLDVVSGTHSEESQSMFAFSGLLAAFPATAELAIISMALSLLIGIPIGIHSATSKRKVKANVSRGLALIGVGIPIYVAAYFLKVTIIYTTFSIDALFNHSWIHLYKIFPYAGRYSETVYTYPAQLAFGLFPPTGFLLLDSLLSLNIPLFLDGFLHLLLPASILAFAQIAYISRMTRASMVEVLKEDYILYAKSKGLHEKTILYRHALINALFPVLTTSTLILASLFTGVVFVEYIFEWPGMAQLATIAVLNLHLDTIMSFVILSAFIYVGCNLCADLAYAWLDPRVREKL
ncbi:MAG: ABC transporter permease [Candidatus Heimdallarchaeota archaeon]|nr:MAG: ABC transporter permease [Candidatus Heimdallarchaeota archaeon]